MGATPQGSAWLPIPLVQSPLSHAAAAAAENLHVVLVDQLGLEEGQSPQRPWLGLPWRFPRLSLHPHPGPLQADHLTAAPLQPSRQGQDLQELG